MAARPAEKTKIVWWHAMTAALGDEVNRLVDAFNQSQDAMEVTAIYKGGYADVLTATIAAFRAGQAPHLAQIFEVGTGSMLAAGKATKQVWELAAGDRRADRSEGVHPGGARLLQPGRRADGVDAVQLVDRGDVVQQGRVPQGRASIRTSRRRPGRTSWRRPRRSRRRTRRRADDHARGRPGSSSNSTARCTTFHSPPRPTDSRAWTRSWRSTASRT